MGKFDIKEPVKDFTVILQEKADIARDRYRPLVNIREILLEAKMEIERLRKLNDEYAAEVARLNQLVKY